MNPSGYTYPRVGRSVPLVWRAVLLLILPATSLRAAPSLWTEAERNAAAAQEALVRCDRLMEAWLAYRDPATSLLPQNLSSPVWTPENSAADLWPFFVLTSYFTNRDRFDGIIPRHRLHLQLPLNYPRLNEWPEWWTAEPTDLYRVEYLQATAAETENGNRKNIKAWPTSGRDGARLSERSRPNPAERTSWSCSGVARKTSAMAS